MTTALEKLVTDRREVLARLNAATPSCGHVQYVAGLPVDQVVAMTPDEFAEHLGVKVGGEEV